MDGVPEILAEEVSQKKTEKELSEKKKQFAALVAQGYTPTAAARELGNYTHPNSPRVIGGRWAHEERVRDEIARVRAEQSRNAQSVAELLLDIARDHTNKAGDRVSAARAWWSAMDVGKVEGAASKINIGQFINNLTKS